MSRIAYDPIKDRMAAFIRNRRLFRTFFYILLNLLFLRSWYIRRLLKSCGVLTAPHEKDPPAVLDAGCGFGQYDRFMLHRFPSANITAIDVKESYLDDCRHYFSQQREQGRIQFNNQNLLSLDISDTFDLAFCVDVLEHIEKDVQAMQNIQESLKSGGCFIMHSPSIYSAKDAGSDESFVDEHARTGYSEENLDAKLKTAGFKPLNISYTYGPKGHLAWRMLIQYPMLWLNRWTFWISPFLMIYYIITLPAGLLLMKLDTMSDNKTGTGIYAVAVKKS